jgi:hydrogenase nickel incorporation protein HypA/HybF
MHELHLARTVVSILTEQARVHRYARVRRVELRLGELGHLDADAFAFGFDVAARGSLAEGAVLCIERLPGEARCPVCGTTSAIRSRVDACPVCGAEGLVVTGGDGMTIGNVEVE